MSSHAQQLAALVDGEYLKERGNLAFRKDFASQTRSLFESFGAPLAGLSDPPFADLLKTMAAFPAYSLGNQTLISLQAPLARSLSSAERWAEYGRRLVRHARPVQIWAPADSRTFSERSASGFARPTIERAEEIAFSLGLRVTQGGEYLFDAQAISRNPLWGSLQTWRSIRAVLISDGEDHISIRLITKDGRALDRRARTMVGLVKALMQAGSLPNDETINEYLTRGMVSHDQKPSKRTRDFFQKFKMVPVYDVADTDGPDLPEMQGIDYSMAFAKLTQHLHTRNIEVIVGAGARATHVSRSSATIYIDDQLDESARLSSLLDASADLLSQRQADGQNRDLLKAERDAVSFVLRTHFNLPSAVPELGRGLAPDVEPHSSAEVVKARLLSIQGVAKEIMLAASPNYENALLKALSAVKQAAEAVVPAPELGTPSEKPINKLIVAPQIRTARGKRVSSPIVTSIETEAAKVEAAAEVISQANEDFNPFAEPVVADEADFNPFA